jgi:succinate dehydrogenase / fumarate reductase cytochrome b subunit
MINGKEYHDLGQLVIAKFQIPGFIIFYIASFLFLGFHLIHGFQSAFRSLGIENRTYTPVINRIGVIYTFLVVAGFTAIPIVIYFIR